MMRTPSLHSDGWELDNGVESHLAAPETFWIPDEAARQSLAIGDLAKLIFRISVDDPEEPVKVERMWVIVREVKDGLYFGLLDNEPDTIAENDEFWIGTEVPFGPEHVINIEKGDAKSRALAHQQPLRSWPRA